MPAYGFFTTTATAARRSGRASGLPPSSWSSSTNVAHFRIVTATPTPPRRSGESSAATAPRPVAVPARTECGRAGLSVRVALAPPSMRSNAPPTSSNPASRRSRSCAFGSPSSSPRSRSPARCPGAVGARSAAAAAKAEHDRDRRLLDARRIADGQAAGLRPSTEAGQDRARTPSPVAERQRRPGPRGPATARSSSAPAGSCSRPAARRLDLLGQRRQRRLDQQRLLGRPDGRPLRLRRHRRLVVQLPVHPGLRRRTRPTTCAHASMAAGRANAPRRARRLLPERLRTGRRASRSTTASPRVGARRQGRRPPSSTPSPAATASNTGDASPTATQVGVRLPGRGQVQGQGPRSTARAHDRRPVRRGDMGHGLQHDRRLVRRPVDLRHDEPGRLHGRHAADVGQLVRLLRPDVHVRPAVQRRDRPRSSATVQERHGVGDTVLCTPGPTAPNCN